MSSSRSRPRERRGWYVHVEPSASGAEIKYAADGVQLEHVLPSGKRFTRFIQSPQIPEEAALNADAARPLTYERPPYWITGHRKLGWYTEPRD